MITVPDAPPPPLDRYGSDLLVLIGLLLVAGSLAAIAGPAVAVLVAGTILLALGIYRGVRQ